MMKSMSLLFFGGSAPSAPSSPNSSFSSAMTDPRHADTRRICRCNAHASFSCDARHAEATENRRSSLPSGVDVEERGADHALRRHFAVFTHGGNPAGSGGTLGTLLARRL